jgi:hypothetical protein
MAVAKGQAPTTAEADACRYIPAGAPALGTGRDAFHCVPDCWGKNGDAVGSVPTRFRGSRRTCLKIRFASRPRPRPSSSSSKFPAKPRTRDEGRGRARGNHTFFRHALTLRKGVPLPRRAGGQSPALPGNTRAGKDEVHESPSSQMPVMIRGTRGVRPAHRAVFAVRSSAFRPLPRVLYGCLTR